MKRLFFLLVVLCAPFVWAGGYADHPKAQAFIARMTERHGFSEAELWLRFSHLQPMARVLELIAPPRDARRKSWQAYRARFVDPRRIEKGLSFWRRHAATLARAQARYGVPAEIIVAILGVETLYGKDTGRFPTLATLATLAFDYPPRAELFERELEALLLLAREEGRPPESYYGSYAGAIGLPQFLPSSIRAYAVDFDGDARIDLERSAADAIGSIANFLSAHGWREGAPVAVKVDVEGTAMPTLGEENIQPSRRASEFAAYGLRLPRDLDDAPAALIDLPTPEVGAEYWLGFQNFYVLTRYNRSSFYAMAVCQLADALRARWAAQEAQSRLDSPRPACSS
ncbi:MAG: lytic murein transglycosylase B [Rhodocyclaceae bacterium]|nr:lytic murein transglycosylase B [Rhodocyclaceae bacterium]